MIFRNPPNKSNGENKKQKYSMQRKIQRRTMKLDLQLDQTKFKTEKRFTIEPFAIRDKINKMAF